MISELKSRTNDADSVVLVTGFASDDTTLGCLAFTPPSSFDSDWAETQQIFYYLFIWIEKPHVLKTRKFEFVFINKSISIKFQHLANMANCILLRLYNCRCSSLILFHFAYCALWLFHNAIESRRGTEQTSMTHSAIYEKINNSKFNQTSADWT